MPRTPRQARPKQVDDYRHDEASRLNNPEAGLAPYVEERPTKAAYAYDPHLDPQLVWAGKAERLTFEVDAVSLHIHERLATEAIVKTLEKEEPQLALFGDPQLTREEKVAAYEHDVDWTNRLILGDSLVVMTSLLERERMKGKVQCVYFDPPYGIGYNSNFQSELSNRAPRENDDALTREPEAIQAYRDTWILREHSYLTYLRDRLLLCHELLAETGSIFVQIGPDRTHLVRALLDEVFKAQNHVATITLQKTSQVTSALLPEVADFLLWYAVDKKAFPTKYRQLYEDRGETVVGSGAYRHVELADGTRRPMSPEERADVSLLPEGSRAFAHGDATSQGFSPGKTVEFEFNGRLFHPGANRHWLLRPEGMRGLADAGRLTIVGETLRLVRYADESGLVRRTNIWTDTGQAGFAQRKKQYVVETNPKIVERCLLMASDPGDLVFDPTCGSGTTAYVAEKLGRRWITADTSRVALALARERILTATYPWYQLVDETRGVDGGFRYQTRPWVRASTIGYGAEEFESITLYDQPQVDGSRIRVSGPFTVESPSRYAVNPFDETALHEPGELTASADHVNALLDALRVRGIPVRRGKPVQIESLTRIAGTSPLHAECLTADGCRIGVSIGPRYGPITLAQVDDALHDAYGYDLVVFAGFTADAEAQALLSKGKAGRFEVVLLEANADLLVTDLLRNTKSSQTFRLFSAPDVQAHEHPDGCYVELRGLDTYDAATGQSTETALAEVRAWFLDHDYDGACFRVCQAFFPHTKSWESLARALKGTIEDELLARLAEYQSNPFRPGKHRRAAVRVVSDSGQTSEAVVDLTAFADQSGV